MTLHSLPIFVRLQGRAVILVGEGEAAEAKRRLLARAGALVVGEDAAAALAIVVDDDAAAARLTARGVLVNVVDRPELCDFTLPAIVDRAPVLVAIGTGGVSAGLAASLRQRLEAVLPAGLGRLAEALYAARAALRARFPDMGDRRRAIAAALAAGGVLDPLLPHDAPDAARIGEGAGAAVVPIRLRSGDPDDLTLREARWLAAADRVTHRADVPAAILDRARADAVRVETDAPPAVADVGLTVDVRWDGTSYGTPGGSPLDKRAPRGRREVEGPPTPMPDIRRIDDRLSVAPQIAPQDVPALAAAGFVAIVNNRPDGEEPGQPTGDAIRAAAAAAGLSYIAIPVTQAGFSHPQVDAMAAALAGADGPVLAYCRSGTRSCNLWALTAAKAGDDVDALGAKAAAAGYDLTNLRPLLDALKPGA